MKDILLRFRESTSTPQVLAWTVLSVVLVLARVNLTLICKVLRFRVLQRLLVKVKHWHGLVLSKLMTIRDAPEHHVRRYNVTTPVDDVVLSGSLFLPVDDDEGSGDDIPTDRQLPCILIRTPYDRRLYGSHWSYVFASHGYAVLLQDTRGRFGSSGDFFPVKDEVNDGGKTCEWIRKQPWSNGKIGTFGVSYLGLTALAAAGYEEGQHVDVSFPVMASANTYNIVYHDGVLALDLVLRWLFLVLGILKTGKLHKFAKLGMPSVFGGELEAALMDVPVNNQDSVLLGEQLEYFQNVLEAHDPKHPFWEGKDILCDLTHPKCPPTYIVAGWYDFFMKSSFKDYAAGCNHKAVTLTVGPWSHWNLKEYEDTSMKMAMHVFDHKLKDDQQQHPPKQEDSIHVYVLESQPQTWCSFSSWPPPNMVTRNYRMETMSKGQLLAIANNVEDEPVRELSFLEFTFDPEHPTPSIGGPAFDMLNRGRCEQSALLDREDVLVFDSGVLHDPVHVIGDVGAVLHLSSTNPNTDVFLKLCDVHPDGSTYNICERMLRISPDEWQQTTESGCVEGTFQVAISPIAVSFHPGHRIRLLVAGGAHPLYMRNHGISDLQTNATEMAPATQRLFNDSVLKLPVVDSLVADQAFTCEV